MDKKIEIDIAIVLCHLIEEWDVFIKNLDMFRKDGFFITYDTLYDLENIANHELCFGKRKIKCFYKDNQATIDKIKKYMPIHIFIKYINLNDYRGRVDINNLYFYLLRNKDQKAQILAVLEQIKTLGFQYIEFSESLDFSKKEYKIYKNAAANYQEIYFLENMKRIPAYGTEEIKYQSQDSSYRIPFRYYPNSSSGKFFFENYIEVNNLLFDVNTLPQIKSPSTATDIIQEMIKTLGQECEEECKQITNAVHLNTELTDLEKNIDSMDKMAKELICFEERKELSEALLHMKVEFTKMKQISNGYEKQITSEDSLVTEDMLKRERIAYQDRKNWTDFD